MNFLQLVNRLRQECGVTGADLTSVTSQTGESLRCVNWIISAWTDIQSERQDWEFLRRTCTFVTTSGQPTYTAAQCGVTDWGMWDRDTFRNYANPQVTISIASPGVVTYTAHGLSVGDTVTLYTDGALPTGLTAGTAYYVQAITANTFTLSATSGGSAINTSGTQSGTHTMTTNNTTVFAGFRTEIYMDYLEYDTWRDSYLYGNFRTQQTRPLQITVTPNKSIGLGPLPASGYTVIGDYFSTPTVLSAATDTPSMPSQFHMAIVYKAMQSYGMYEAASEVLQRGQGEYLRLIRRVYASQMREITMPGALA